MKVEVEIPDGPYCNPSETNWCPFLDEGEIGTACLHRSASLRKEGSTWEHDDLHHIGVEVGGDGPKTYIYLKRPDCPSNP